MKFLCIYGDQSCVPTEPYFPAPNPACSTKRYNNRYGHLNNLEPMQEVEESEPQVSGSTSSRGSQASEVTEMESPLRQSNSSEQRGGEVTSMSEFNPGGATKSSEPRLALKAHKNHYDKIPPPARPNSPQRRASSQPSTPRHRSEAHLSLQVSL